MALLLKAGKITGRVKKIVRKLIQWHEEQHPREPGGTQVGGRFRVLKVGTQVLFHARPPAHGEKARRNIGTIRGVGTTHYTIHGAPQSARHAVPSYRVPFHAVEPLSRYRRKEKLEAKRKAEQLPPQVEALEKQRAAKRITGLSEDDLAVHPRILGTVIKLANARAAQFGVTRTFDRSAISTVKPGKGKSPRGSIPKAHGFYADVIAETWAGIIQGYRQWAKTAKPKEILHFKRYLAGKESELPFVPAKISDYGRVKNLRLVLKEKVQEKAPKTVSVEPNVIESAEGKMASRGYSAIPGMAESYARTPLGSLLRREREAGMSRIVPHLKRLHPVEAEIVRRKFGLEGRDPGTHAEMADETSKYIHLHPKSADWLKQTYGMNVAGISAASVGELLKQAVEKLRKQRGVIALRQWLKSQQHRGLQDLAKALEPERLVIRATRWFFKAEEAKKDYPPPPPGSRWITLGDGEGAQHVLVMPRKDKSWVVIGGAGGALEHLVLTGIKEPEEYKRLAAERREKEKLAQHSEGVTEEERAASREEIRQEKEARQKLKEQFVNKLSAIAGVDLQEKVADAIAKREERKKELEDRAARGEKVEANPEDREASDQEMQRRALEHLQKSAEADAANELATQTIGESVVDQEVKPDTGSSDLNRELLRMKLTPEQRNDVLKAIAEHRQARRELRGLKRKPHILGERERILNLHLVGQSISDEEVKRLALDKVLNAQRTRMNSDFYNMLDNHGMGSERHTRSGAQDTFNTLSHAFLGERIIPATLIDTLGVAGASMVVAQTLIEEGKAGGSAKLLSDRLEQMGESVVKEAIKKAKPNLDMAKLVVEQAEQGLMAKTTAQGYALRMTLDALRDLGGAAGSLNAAATTLHALQEGTLFQIQAKLGTNLVRAEEKMNGLGLTLDTDYFLKKVGSEWEVSIRQGAFSKILRPGNAAYDRSSEVARIKRDEMYEEDWLPEGMNPRPFGAEKDAIKLSKEQQRIIRFGLAQKKALIDGAPGIGKTACYMGIDLEARRHGVTKSIIIVPADKRIDFKEDYSGDKKGKKGWAPGLKVALASGDPGKRREKYEAWKRGDADVLIIGHDTLRGGSSLTERQQMHGVFRRENIAAGMPRRAADKKAGEQVMEWTDKSTDIAQLKDLIASNGPDKTLLIIDELHDLINPHGREEAQRAGALRELQSDWMMAGSGTLMRNDISELGKEVNWLKPGYIDVPDFQKRYKTVGFGVSAFGSAAKEALRREVNDVMVSAKYDLPKKPEFHQVDLDLSPQQKERSRQIEMDYAHKRDVEGYTRASGERDARHDENLHDGPWRENAKIVEALKRLDEPENEGRKALFFFEHKPGIKSMMEALTEKYGKGAAKEYTGDVGWNDRQKIRDAFNNGDGPRFLVLTSAGAQGINLQGATMSYNMDLPPSAAEMDQRNARAARIGQGKKVDLYNMVSRTPYDARRLSIIARKKGLIASLGNPDENGILDYMGEHVEDKHIPLAQRTQKSLRLGLRI